MGILKLNKTKIMAPTKKSQRNKKISPKKSPVKKIRARKSGAKRGGRARAKMFMKGHKETYNTYIFRVLKQVHPDLRISSKAISIVDALCKDVEGRMQKEMRSLCNIVSTRTCNSRQAMAATRLVLPGELGKHAVQEGSKALAKMK